jgi:hypothetical protein
LAAKLDHVKPRWVLVDGILREVSEFAHILPRKRPAAICPVCQCPVILKLGSIRTHHYAHHPGDVCIITQPETALHLNTKFFIYKQLLKTSVLYIGQSCSGNCGKDRRSVWLRDWESLQIEYTFDAFRPDIAMVSEGQVVGAIEITVTHPTDEPKAKHYEERGIRWVEVRACESIYQGDVAWMPESPLPFSSYHPRFEKWVCNDCEEQQRKEQERREYEKHNYEVIHAAKMIDFYYRSGKKYREVYLVMKRVRDAQWVKAWVQTENNVVVASEDAPITKESLRRLGQAVQQRIEQYAQKAMVVDDYFMEWRSWMTGKKFVARDIERYPFRYIWSGQECKWVFCEDAAYSRY